MQEFDCLIMRYLIVQSVPTALAPDALEPLVKAYRYKFANDYVVLSMWWIFKTTTADFWKMIIELLPILSEKRKKNIILKGFDQQSQDDTYKCCTPAFYKQSYVSHGIPY